MNFFKPQHVVLRLTNSQAGDLETVQRERRRKQRQRGVTSKWEFQQTTVVWWWNRSKDMFWCLFWLFWDSFSFIIQAISLSVGDSYKALKKSEVSAQIHKHENQNMNACKQSQVSSPRPASTARVIGSRSQGGQPYYHCAFEFVPDWVSKPV